MVEFFLSNQIFNTNFSKFFSFNNSFSIPFLIAFHVQLSLNDNEIHYLSCLYFTWHDLKICKSIINKKRHNNNDKGKIWQKKRALHTISAYIKNVCDHNSILKFFSAYCWEIFYVLCLHLKCVLYVLWLLKYVSHK